MKKRIALTIVLILLALLLAGCRVRTTVQAPLPGEETGTDETPVSNAPEQPGNETEPDEPADDPARENEGEPDDGNVHDEDAERREYAQDASGEIAPDANDALLVPADENGTADPAPENGAANYEQEGADKTATETVPADEADKAAAGEDGAVADSVLTYYLTLLDSRLGALFECKRFYVYWETAEVCRTIQKTSAEHDIIIGAGAYDVSAKLLPENLTVDDGWIARKNPDAVVKVVGSDVLGRGVTSDDKAAAVGAALLDRPGWSNIGAVQNGTVILLSEDLLGSQSGRIAAMLYIAKVLYPDQMTDVDPDEAFRELTNEANDASAGGRYVYVL